MGLYRGFREAPEGEAATVKAPVIANPLMVDLDPATHEI
jgi:hypothetical protein